MKPHRDADALGSLREKYRGFRGRRDAQVASQVDQDKPLSDLARWNAGTDRIRVKTDARRADTELRGIYARRAFGLASLAVWFWMAMFTVTAISNFRMGLPALSDGALITLTSGATINVVAICLVVVRGLFRGRPARKLAPVARVDSI